jgi:hypothetical protein
VRAHPQRPDTINNLLKSPISESLPKTVIIKVETREYVARSKPISPILAPIMRACRGINV